MNALRLRLTACGVTALLVLLVPLAAAEGEYWKEPDTITFPGGGSVAAGRVENLLEQDGRTMKLADSADEVYALMTPPVPSGGSVDDWNHTGCPPSGADGWQCVDDIPLNGTDGNASYLWTNGTAAPGNVRQAFLEFEEIGNLTDPGDVLVGVNLHWTWLTIGTCCVGNDPVVTVRLRRIPDAGPPVECAFPGVPGVNRHPASDPPGANAPYNWTSLQTIPYPPNETWDLEASNDFLPCGGTGPEDDPFEAYFTYFCASPPCLEVRITGVGLSAIVNAHLLTADLSLGATGYYPIRAEWTCTARTGGPYYLGALNTTGSTRWFNVTRDATNASYPSGEMCAVPGATERYHATMTAADFGSDGRVHFRISDNSSDPSGSAWGNITLDRLVAILTQDFGVSVGNLGWLVYLGFLTVGILIAAFAYHRWREHGSGA